jgi:hypothetical protein
MAGVWEGLCLGSCMLGVEGFADETAGLAQLDSVADEMQVGLFCCFCVGVSSGLWLQVC